MKSDILLTTRRHHVSQNLNEWLLWDLREKYTRVMLQSHTNGCRLHATQFSLPTLTTFSTIGVLVNFNASILGTKQFLPSLHLGRRLIHSGGTLCRRNRRLFIFIFYLYVVDWVGGNDSTIRRRKRPELARSSRLRPHKHLRAAIALRISVRVNKFSKNGE